MRAEALWGRETAYEEPGGSEVATIRCTLRGAAASEWTDDSRCVLASYSHRLVLVQRLLHYRARYTSVQRAR